MHQVNFVCPADRGSVLNGSFQPEPIIRMDACVDSKYMIRDAYHQIEVIVCRKIAAQASLKKTNDMR